MPNPSSPSSPKPTPALPLARKPRRILPQLLYTTLLLPRPRVRTRPEPEPNTQTPARGYAQSGSHGGERGCARARQQGVEELGVWWWGKGTERTPAPMCGGMGNENEAAGGGAMSAVCLAGRSGSRGAAWASALRWGSGAGRVRRSSWRRWGCRRPGSWGRDDLLLHLRSAVCDGVFARDFASIFLCFNESGDVPGRCRGRGEAFIRPMSPFLPGTLSRAARKGVLIQGITTENAIGRNWGVQVDQLKLWQYDQDTLSPEQDQATAKSTIFPLSVQTQYWAFSAEFKAHVRKFGSYVPRQHLVTRVLPTFTSNWSSGPLGSNGGSSWNVSYSPRGSYTKVYKEHPDPPASLRRCPPRPHPARVKQSPKLLLRLGSFCRNGRRSVCYEVGYPFRFEDSTSDKTVLKCMTEDMLLRQSRRTDPRNYPHTDDKLKQARIPRFWSKFCEVLWPPFSSDREIEPQDRKPGARFSSPASGGCRMLVEEFEPAVKSYLAQESPALEEYKGQFTEMAVGVAS
ncbi:hypothetical protein B0H11DRAFT_1920955 [Mycena galericulata]|nr:hypothetical protein B0H11DRAFT_1920955 [Mycena galericulata]